MSHPVLGPDIEKQLMHSLGINFSFGAVFDGFEVFQKGGGIFRQKKLIVVVPFVAEEEHN